MAATAAGEAMKAIGLFAPFSPDPHLMALVVGIDLREETAMSNLTTLVLVTAIAGMNTLFVWRWISKIEERLNEIEKQRFGIDQSDPKETEAGKPGVRKP